MFCLYFSQKPSLIGPIINDFQKGNERGQTNLTCIILFSMGTVEGNYQDDFSSSRLPAGLGGYGEFERKFEKFFGNFRNFLEI